MGDAAIFLVVAEAGVDDNAMRRRLHQERVDAHAQPAVLVGEMRLQPGDRFDRLGRGLRQQEAAAAGDLQFDNLGDDNITDPPLAHACSPEPRFAQADFTVTPG